MAQTHDHTTQHSCPACSFGPFTRNNYFTGKLLVERDFTDETRFHMEKLRHHEQQLHGWGVVCGLKVKPHPNEACRDRFVCIEPGSAVDCCGHDIIVHEEECIDITQIPAIKALKEKKDTDSHTLQICLRYRECPTEEIPVLYDDCGCDDTKCAPNRILESYEIDVIVDPKEEPKSFGTPKLKWENTIAIAHASRVVLHDATHRLYVMTDDDPATVYQVSTDNHAIVTSRTLPAKIVAQAVSNDGKHLYVVVEPTDPATLRQLHVLDTTQAGMQNFNKKPIDLRNSIDSAVELTVMPDGRLLALVMSTGDVWRWDTNLDTNTNPGGPENILTLQKDSQGLLLSSDGKQAFSLVPSTIQIRSIDAKPVSDFIPVSSFIFVSEPGHEKKLSSMALVTSAGPDLLAVVDQNNKQLHLIALNPSAKLVGSVDLDHTPVALVASPGGHWVYVLERDEMAGSLIQPVNVAGLQKNPPDKLGKEFKVVNDSRQVVINETETHLYVPYVDDLNNPALGGVAIVDISEQTCEEILWRHLDGCPHCDIPNCVVLASIENYHIGDRIEDANIDNHKGRHLLPSTQVLTELVECLLEQGTGTQGSKGDKGPPGAGVTSADAESVLPEQDAKAKFDPATGNIHFEIPRGAGLDKVNLTIVACDKEKRAAIVPDGGKRVLELEIPSGCISSRELTHISAINWPHAAKNVSHSERGRLGQEGLLITFDRKVWNVDINKDSFILLVASLTPPDKTPDKFLPDKFLCWYEVPATRIVGGKFNESGVFVPDNDSTSKVNVAQFLPLGGVETRFLPGRQYRVVLKGNFIRDDNNNKGVDADHLPPWFTTSAKDYKTGDGVEGGTFESWFICRE